MKTFKLTRPSNSGKQYVQVSEPVWVDGFKTSEKVGMIEIEPGSDAANEAKVAKLQSGQIQTIFGNQNQRTGLYDVTLQVLTAATPATTSATQA